MKRAVSAARAGVAAIGHVDPGVRAMRRDGNNERPRIVGPTSWYGLDLSNGMLPRVERPLWPRAIRVLGLRGACGR